jgi:predicted RNA binding protein YcfA (HicA-like mRNA interferase family)
MPALPSANWQDVVNAFAKLGWVHDRTKGDHYIMTRQNEPGLLSVPMHRPVKRGTLRRLIRDAGISVADFVKAMGQ